MRAVLASPSDRAGFYRALSGLLAQGVAWDRVEWQTAELGHAPPPAGDAPFPADLLRLPAAFRDTMHLVLLHRDAQRHALLHRVAQRLWQDPRHWQDGLHDDHIRLLDWQRQVRRDMHKTKAFVRFNRVGETAQAPEAAEYVAWFEPLHHTLLAVAPFFVRRFTQMRWSILSPTATVRWDGEKLHTGPGADPAQAPPPDAGEQLWLTYYARIFNPARVKISAMKKEMPEAYWKNLPETRLIPSLLRQAPGRVDDMVAHALDTRRRLPQAELAALPERPGSLAEIALAIQRCDQCACSARATQAVMGSGPASARVVLVGEQPGDQEDLAGRPFVGPAGQLLRAALTEAGVDVSKLYLTNAVKHFSYEMRGKRRLHKTPAQADLDRCLSWLEAELRAVEPALIVALGRSALTAIEKLPGYRPAQPDTSPDGEPVSEPTSDAGAPLERGRWRQARVAAVAHPSALLRAGAGVGSDGFGRWRDALQQIVGAEAH